MARGLDINAEYDVSEDDDDRGAAQDMRVSDWEDGLPSADDLTPLSQLLIPPELASAFSITPEPSRTLLDVHRASQTAISSLCRQPNPFAASSHRRIPSFPVPDACEDHHMAVMEEETEADTDGCGDGGGTSGSSSSAAAEGGDGAGGSLLAETSGLQQQPQHQQGSAGRGGVGVAKRARLVWTPQLHRRFVEVVAHLGVGNAVPKTIMQLMNVEGLTRENVASHLQKYRLYLKRTHGHDDAGAGTGPSSSGAFMSPSYPLQQQQQPTQRLPVTAEGSGSMVRALPRPPTTYAIGVSQPGNHGHRGLDLEQHREWPHGCPSNSSVLAFPHRARVAPNNSS